MPRRRVRGVEVMQVHVIRAIWTLTAAVLLTLMIGVPVLTVCLLLPWRWGFDRCFSVWSRGILAATGIRLTVTGRDRLTPGMNYFFVGNHQSMMDIPAMTLATRGRIRFMAKKSLFRIPWFGWIMHIFGFVPIDRSNARRASEAIDKMFDRLTRRGGSMLVFPEGSRTTDGALGRFKRGSIRVCQRSGLAVVPFAIDGTFSVHRRGEFFIRPGPVRIVLGEPIESGEVSGMSPDALLERVRETVSRLLARSGSKPVTAGVAMAACGGVL